MVDRYIFPFFTEICYVFSTCFVVLGLLVGVSGIVMITIPVPCGAMAVVMDQLQ